MLGGGKLKKSLYARLSTQGTSNFHRKETSNKLTGILLEKPRFKTNEERPSPKRAIGLKVVLGGERHERQEDLHVYALTTHYNNCNEATEYNNVLKLFSLN